MRYKVATQIRLMPNKITLTPEQEAWLARHYKHTLNADICRRFGICEATLHRIARESGLKKSRQFMSKVTARNQLKAVETNRANGWPPKGYAVPNRDLNCFKKGESNKDRLSPERYAEYIEKKNRSWAATRKRDRARFVFGFDQKTKFRFVRQSNSKLMYRYNMKKKGYITNIERNVFFYPDEGMRCPVAERHAPRHGIEIRPLDK